MKRQRLGILVCAGVLLAGFASPALAVDPQSSPRSSSAQSEHDPIEGQDYVYSVIDDEDPSEVEQRAREAVGDRFVELWISDDQRAFVIGVVNLQENEKPKLLRTIQRKAPVQLVHRDVSRAEVDALLKQVQAEDAENPGTITAYGRDYVHGTVNVLAKANAAGSVESRLKTRASKQRKTVDARTHRISAAQERNRKALHAAYSTPTAEISEGEINPTESATANPYRAGKKIEILNNGRLYRCTAGFMVKKAGKIYGVTAGHCGTSGSAVYFGGKRRGNLQNNTYYASNPAKNDSALFLMAGNTSATLFRSTTKNYKVTGYYATKYLKMGQRLCIRGAASDGQTCGPIIARYDQAKYDNRVVNNQWRIKWDNGPWIREGDSGAPVYRIIGNNAAVYGAGVLSGVTENSPIASFSPLPSVIATTGSSTLYTTK